MNRYALIASIAVLGLAAFVVDDLLGPETVPVAEAVELTGTAPADGPPRDGFFIVPPPVVDFREPSQEDVVDDEMAQPDDDIQNDGGRDNEEGDDDPDGSDDGTPDGFDDDEDDDLDDEDDSVDDDD